MKLPESKQDRVKLLIVVLLATALVLLGLLQGIVSPLLAGHRVRMERLKQCQQGLQMARDEIARESKDRQRNQKALAEITNLSDRFILHPVLGNYVLSASQILESFAATNGLTMEPVREVGITDLPLGRSTKTAVKTFSTYTARVTLSCGYNSLTAFLHDVETGNPYVSVANLKVVGDSTVNPEIHSVTLDIQWPIWVDNRMPGLLADPAIDIRRPPVETVPQT